MLKRTLYILSMMLLFLQCEVGERLEGYPESGPLDYFIECYCRPDSAFEMTATRIAPFSDLQILDYDVQLEACITAQKPIPLHHGIKRRPDTYFLYNYSSTERLDAQSTDTLYLDITIPGHEKLTASTAIPLPVHIDSVRYADHQVHTWFTTDAGPENNYYILAVSWLNDKWNHALFFMKGHQDVQSICRTTHIKKDDIREIRVSLKRMTPEGYLYQYTCNEARRASNDSHLSPVRIEGNIEGAMGVFTCYTEDLRILHF